MPDHPPDIAAAQRITATWYGHTWGSWVRAWGADAWRALQSQLVHRADIRPGSTVLDIGTGTGGTVIGAALKARDAGYVVGIDNSPVLAQLARANARSTGLANVAFAVTDLGRLGFSDQAFDRVISSFAIHGSFPPGIGLREARRVLRPGGLLAFSMFGSSVNNGHIVEILETILSHYPVPNPSPFLQDATEALSIVPHGFCPYGTLVEPADPGQVLRLLREYGFTEVEAVVRHARRELRDVGDVLSVFTARQFGLRELPPSQRAEFEQDCAAALGPFFRGGELSLEIEVMFFIGRA